MNDDTIAGDTTLPDTGSPSHPSLAPRPGSLLGRYMVLSTLGAGAMGVVHGAYDPKLDRKVAIKLLHTKVDGRPASPQAQTRLMREAQALAKVSHPNVVAVYDVGTVGEQVWIAMELVRGRPLGAWLEERPRHFREVLAVMRQAGRGLAAAHAAALLHRDFKPDNVMIDDDGRVRVMDFGLARALDLPEELPTFEGSTSEVGNDALHHRMTRTGALMGTPAYMSPEQLAGQSDARSDQFSLCVTLWEALYGERPYEGETLSELTRSLIAGKLRPPPPERRVPAWVRAICERGLSRAPAERFASIDALLEALDRGFSRARRRRVLLGLAGVVALGGALEGTRRALDTRTRTACGQAGQSIDEVWNEQVRKQVRDGLVATGVSHAQATADRVMPWLDGRAQTWREGRTQVCMNAEVDGRWEPDTTERALGCLAQERLELASLITVLREADALTAHHAINITASSPEVSLCVDPTTLGRLPALDQATVEASSDFQRQLSRAASLVQARRLDEAEALLRTLAHDADAQRWPRLEVRRRHIEGDLLNNAGAYERAEQALVDVYVGAGRLGIWTRAAIAAESLVWVVGHRQARPQEGQTWGHLAQMAAALAGDPLGLREAARSYRLGMLHFENGEREQGRLLVEHALELYEGSVPPDHPYIGTVLKNLLIIAVKSGAYDEAERLAERALAIHRQVYGPEHPEVAGMLNNIAAFQQQRSNLTVARSLLERSLDITTRALGADHPEVATILTNLAGIWRHEDLARAEQLDRRALEIREERLRPGHPDIAVSLNNLASTLSKRNEPEQARALYERALALWEQARGPEHSDVAVALNNLAEIDLETGAHQRARERAQQAVDILERTLGRTHPIVAGALSSLGSAQLVLGDHEPALACFRRSLAIMADTVGPDHPTTAEYRIQLSEALLSVGRLDEAQAELDAARASYDARPGSDEQEAAARFLHARVLLATGADPEPILAAARAALAVCRRSGEHHAKTIARIEAWLSEHELLDDL